MKKIIFLFSLLVVVITTKAQESATQDVSIPYSQTWAQYVPSTVPNATTLTDSVWYYTFLKESTKPLLYDVKLKLDSSSGTARRTTVILQCKVWASDSYANLATKYWVTGHDTSITFTNFATQTYTATMPSYVGTFPTYSDSTGYIGNFASDSTITLNPTATVSFSPSGTTTFAPSATITLTNTMQPLMYRYWRILVRNDTKGFIVKVPELSILFKEQ